MTTSVSVRRSNRTTFEATENLRVAAANETLTADAVPRSAIWQCGDSALSGSVTPCRAVPCRAVPCRAVPCAGAHGAHGVVGVGQDI